VVAEGRGRSLSTARAVLRVLSLLKERPEGVRADEVAEVLCKSPWTARYLLNSLCQEGFAWRDPTTGRYRHTDTSDVGPSQPTPSPLVRMADADGAPPLRGPHLGRSAIDLVRFREALRELSLRTGQRSYLALVDGTQMIVADVVGKRGLPTIDGIRPTLAGQAHALAIGKAILAHADLAAVLEYLGLWGLPPYTASTITDGFAFMEELADIRRRGYAVDREEFQEGFCCVAAPVLDVDRSVVGAIGVSLSARRFEHERAEISEVVSQMAWWTSSRPDDALRAAVREVRRIPGAGPPQRRSRTSSDGRALLLPSGISRRNEWKEVRR